MAAIEVKFEYTDMERAEFVFGKEERTVCGAFRAAKDWADGDDDPGITVQQAEVLRDLADIGLTIVIKEDGAMSVKDI